MCAGICSRTVGGCKAFMFDKNNGICKIGTYAPSLGKLKNLGKECWTAGGCGRDGPCAWCGTEGLCCRKAPYILVDTPNTFNCHPITTSSECEAAAQSLGLPDTSAVPSPLKDTDSWGDPPYCYIEDGSLKFNANGSNTGKCGEAYNGEQRFHDKCLCKSSSTPIDQSGNEAVDTMKCRHGTKRQEINFSGKATRNMNFSFTLCSG